MAAVAGLLWGLATLTRELSLYLVPIPALWLLRPRLGVAGAPRAFQIQDLTPAAVLVLATVLTVVPWTIRNAVVFRAFVPVSTMGGLNLWQGNTTLTHLEIYEVLATKGGPVEQDRYCREMAWRTIADRQPGWALEKIAGQMPEFWKAGSEVLDHIVGRQACGPLPAATLGAVELLVVLPYRSLSQNSILWGSARYGVSAESVLALDVVLADGTILRTGASAVATARPFFRYYGPDLTGIFLGDAGAFGIKARIALRLIRRPAWVDTASFGFATHEQMAGAMTEIAREGLVSECFEMDPVLTAQRLKRAGLAQDLKAVKGVITSARSLASGLK